MTKREKTRPVATVKQVDVDTTSPATQAFAGAALAPNVTQADIDRQRATVVTRAGFNAAVLVGEYAIGTGGELKLGDLIHAVMDDVEKVWAGDMKQPEAMLFAQAQALQSIFVRTAVQAKATDKVAYQDMLMRMALKAQNQCRMTLETLANIKNPPLVFARQANINNGGQQQVNNGTAESTPGRSHAAISPARATRAKRTIRSSTHDQSVDAGAARTSGRADQVVAAVGKGNRPGQR